MSAASHPQKLLDDLGRGKRLSRRQFMTLLGAVAAGEFVAAQLGPLRRVLASGTAGGSADGVTVFLYLGGGNDGINTVVPLAAAEYSRYVSLRTKTIDGVTSSIAYPMPGTPNRADALLAGDASIGFNPGMANIAGWYRGGKVAVVQGVGYSNANFSHFESQEHWWGGSGAAGSAVSYKPPSGWLGRFADTAGLTSIGAISVNSGGSLNPSLRSLTSDALAISPWQGNRLGASTSGRDQRAAVAVRAMTQQTTLGALGNDWSKLGGTALDLAPVVNNAYTGIVSGSSGLKRQLTMAANLIGANLGTRVVHTDTGGFDTHENQRKANASGVEWHTGLWMDIDDSLNQFFSLLSPTNRRRVTVVIYSEFGRRAEMNGTFGTDHGAGSVALVIGDNVKGGRYGEYPSLLDLRDPETGGGGNLKSSVDFRQLYATLLQGWLGVDPVPIIGAQHQILPMFAAAPGDVPGQTTTTSTSTSTPTSTSTSSSTSTTTTGAAATSTIAATTSTVAATTSTTATTTTATPTTVANPTTSIVTTTTVASTTPTTAAPTSTEASTSTVAPTTVAPTTIAPTTIAPTTVAPTVATTIAPTTVAPTVATTSTMPATATTTSMPATTVVATSTTRPSTTTTRPSTTTTTPDRRPVPADPKSTPSPGTPDSVNTVVETVVPPAPPPAEAGNGSSTSTTSAPRSSTTVEPSASTTIPRPTTTTSASESDPTATTVASPKKRPRTTRKPPSRLALNDSATKKAKANRPASKERVKTTASVVSRLRNR